MRTEPLRLDDLIETIADGSSIDWDSLDVSTLTERERRLLGHLRVVAGVAETHRSVPDDEPTSATVSLPSLDGLAPPVPSWGHLQLLERIGEGTFGEVYRARDRWLDREVALKLLKPGAAGDVPAARILHEARTLARMRHPNVVMVHGADVRDGRVGLWMEFVKGRTVSSVLALQGPLSANEAALIGQQVCRALAAVHAAGLVHRDVKAQNVMREAGGRVVLMDFGAGQLVDSNRAPTLRPAGTPVYLAPELLDGRDATIQSDIYAVGVLLYHLVTGSYPVAASSLVELEIAHACGDQRRLRDMRPDVQDAFVAVVERALDPNPVRRFRTAGELEGALARVTSGGLADRPVAVRSDIRRERWRLAWPWAALVATLMLATGAGTAYWRTTRGAPSVSQPAVQLMAVLPLQDLSGSDAYLADSMTEALTQELSTAGPLRVVSRTSVARLVAANTPIPELAKTLKADAVVEGSVFRSGQEVRVSVRVIHAGTNTAVWASTFERASPDLPRLQQEIARAIASELRLALHPRTVERWEHSQQVNVAAYDEYLRGRYELRKQTPAGVQGALEHFRRSTAIEPRYARAHVGIAESLLLLGGTLGILPSADAARLAKDADVRALQLDETLPNAHAVLAGMKFEFDWDFAGAEVQFRRAIELDPSSVEPRLEYANFLTSRGRFDEAFQQLSAARAVDPLSPEVADSIARAHYYARRYDQALAEIQRALQLEPASMPSEVGLCRILNATGRYEEAIAQCRRAAAQSSSHPFFEAEIAQIEAGAGRVDDARRRIAALQSKISDPLSHVGPHMLALAYARLDKEEAFKWLARAFEASSVHVLWLKVDPRFDPLRYDARFAAYLKRLQLEP